MVNPLCNIIHNWVVEVLFGYLNLHLGRGTLLRGPDSSCLEQRSFLLILCSALDLISSSYLSPYRSLPFYLIFLLCNNLVLVHVFSYNLLYLLYLLSLFVTTSEWVSGLELEIFYLLSLVSYHPTHPFFLSVVFVLVY